jgi:hypothetical protein
MAGLFATSAAQAQQRFQPGYLVVERGDTVRGLLEAPTRSMVTQGVYFRKNAATEPQLYPIKVVRSLHVAEGKTYVVRKMQPVIHHDTLRLFMEPLVQGRATLYCSSFNSLANDPGAVFANQFSFSYYYIEQENTPNRPPYLLQSSTFKSDLRSLFSDCPNAPAITGKFTADNLIKLVQQYNACATSLTR